jgi:hypothetical protein
MPSVLQSAFLRRLVRARERTRSPDWGDMGTAFGLDQSFDEAAAAERPAAAPAASVAPVSSWRVWLGRKLGR